jgi:toxin ParE1/3/4
MTQPAWVVAFAADTARDLALIEDHLCSAYQTFGESADEATHHAQSRIDRIIIAAERLATAPFRGEARDDLLPGLRHLMLAGAVYWFVPDARAHHIRVLAIFFGAQDHQRHMLVRLLQGPAQ